jgi:hypothetical protein
MNLVVNFTPYTSANLRTKLVFKTSYSVLLDSERGLEKRADFPKIPTTDITLKYIQPIIDLIIVSPEANTFLQPPDFAVMDAEDCLTALRRKALTGRYKSFSDFVADLDLIVQNGVETNSKRQSAMRLSYIIRDLLLRIESGAENPYSDWNPAAAEARIATSFSSSRKVRQEMLSRTNSVAAPIRARDVERRSSRMTESEMDNLVLDLKKLKSSALIGVVEIVTRKPFSLDLLPCEVDLGRCDERVIEKLRQYVNCVRDASGQYYYSWTAQIPDSLREIRDKYENDLVDWLKPPREIPS